MVSPTTTVSPTITMGPPITVGPTIRTSPAIMAHPSIMAYPTIIVDLTTLVNIQTLMTMPPLTILAIPTTPATPTTMVRPTIMVEPTTPHPLPWLLLMALFMVITTMVAGDIMIGPATVVIPTTMMGSLTTIGGPTTMVDLTTMAKFPIIVGSITKVSLTTVRIPTPMVALTITVRSISMVSIILKSTTTEGLFIMERPIPTIPMRGPTRIAYLAPADTTVSTTTATIANATTATMQSATMVSTTTRSITMASTTMLYVVMIISLVITAMGSTIMISNKVHPQDSSSTTSLETWSKEDEQFQKRKTARTQRAHKKLHTVNLFYRLWEKLSHLTQRLRGMLRNLTESLPFEAFIFLVVSLNTIMLVAQTFAEVEVRGVPSLWYFMALDSVFLCIYVVEAVLKIIALGLKYFSDSWNILDFFIMIMAMLDFMLLQFNSFSFVYHQSVFRIFKVFKSLRALRAIRVLRRLSFLTSLQEVTGTLVRSLPSVTAILILMRFQNIFTTVFTLFTMLTLDDWSLIYLDSRAQGAWYIIPILMIYIIIQYFIFLNLVIAVLVDNFQMALLKGLEKIKQERAARIHENLLDDSLTELRKSEPEEVVSEHTKQKQLIEKKFGTMTEKQRELLFRFLQLVAGVEHHQQKFRSQASVLDEIVDTAFETGEEDFRK
ncbi:cation channel sperm-associated protein 1 isoform X1 [Prionailurus iriomotensis]